ncbi:MAG: TauD/TfdA family dioxygenase [Gammaproteobacteria bacterium]|nr:TauD/TfdA family dioxygenase [Gammaproteobacteria bacterium]
MTANRPHERPIDDPAAWESARIGGKEGLMHRIGPEHREAFDELLARTRHLPTVEIERADFDHPAVNDLMAAVRDELGHGHGAVIVSGLDAARVELEDLERIYWGLGTHLGRAMPQSARGDRLGHVRKTVDNPTGRGYLMDIELGPHSDFHEILSLAGVRSAAEGGISGLVSGLAVHNAIRALRPDLLPALYEGFYHSNGPDRPLSAEKVPIFAETDGVLSCFFMPMLWTVAAVQMGVELPEEFAEALDCFTQQATRPELQASFVLEPGEMMFWNNFVCLHSRSAFRDTPEQTRLLLRLWINPHERRPVPAAFLEQARLLDEAHERGETGADYSAALSARRT